MKNKKALKIIFKVIFILSFIPLAYLLIYSIYSAFAGYTPTNFIGQTLDTIYGFEAFEYVFFWMFIGLCYTMILPLCTLYELIYIIVSVVKKVKTKKLMKQ